MILKEFLKPMAQDTTIELRDNRNDDAYLCEFYPYEINDPRYKKYKYAEVIFVKSYSADCITIYINMED